MAWLTCVKHAPSRAFVTMHNLVVLRQTSWPCVAGSDVNKDWTCKEKDKDNDQAYKDKDKDETSKDKNKDFTYSYLLQVAAKPTIVIEQQQQWTQSESSQHMTVKPITLNK